MIYNIGHGSHYVRRALKTLWKVINLVKSTQTLYREKKRELIVEIINLSIKLLLCKKKDIQRVHLAKFKKIKEELNYILIRATTTL